MAKKIKKAILAGLTAYAASKMMGKGLKGDPTLSTDRLLKKDYMHDLESKAP